MMTMFLSAAAFVAGYVASIYTWPVITKLRAKASAIEAVVKS